MHEVSLVHALFDQADRAIVPHSSRDVRQMKVRIGELAGVDPELTHFREWLSDTTVGPADLETAKQTLRSVLAYRAWFDQRKGWRYTNPNLEELGLLRIEYRGLASFAADDKRFASAPALLRAASGAVRERVFRLVFDHLRKGLAVDAAALDRTALEPLRETSLKLLRAPWGFAKDDVIQPAVNGWSSTHRSVGASDYPTRICCSAVACRRIWARNFDPPSSGTTRPRQE